MGVLCMSKTGGFNDRQVAVILKKQPNLSSARYSYGYCRHQLH